MLTLTFVLGAPGATMTRRAAQTEAALRRVTHTSEASLNLNPSVSGDGHRLAFESTEDIAAVGGTGHFRPIRVDISGDAFSFTQLGPSSSRAPAPAISQDGSHIAFASKDDPLGTNPDGNSEIFLFDGAHLRQITDTSPDNHAARVRDGNFQPSIADDARIIAFASNRNLTGANADANREIFTYNTATQSFAQLTHTIGAAGASDAKISGDATRLAFLSDGPADAPAQRELVFCDLQTNASRVVASGVDKLALAYGRAISDDGTRLVYAAETASNASQVFLFDSRRNLTRQITALGPRASDVALHPTISGDGTRIAFATRRSVTGGNPDGSIELYLYDIPTNRFTRLTNAPAAAAAEVVASLNDTGSLVAFSFPRVLSEAVSASDLANNSEIYLATVAPRPAFSTDLKVLSQATSGKEPSTVKAVAPDSIAVALGNNLALTTREAARQPNGSFPSTLDGTTVTVNNRPAQIFYVSPTQINFHIPPETELGSAEIIVRNPDGFETRGTVRVLSAAPGVFTESGDGRGPALALDAATLTTAPFDVTDAEGHPRRLIIFSTGVRGTPLAELTATIDGRPVKIEALVSSPDFPGLDQIHLVLPPTLRGAGNVALIIRAGDRASNRTTMTITGGGRAPRAATLTLSPASASVPVDGTLRFVATLRDGSDTEIKDQAVIFSSSDENVVVVDENGLARGVQVGLAGN